MTTGRDHLGDFAARAAALGLLIGAGCVASDPPSEEVEQVAPPSASSPSPSNSVSASIIVWSVVPPPPRPPRRRVAATSDAVFIWSHGALRRWRTAGPERYDEVDVPFAWPHSFVGGDDALLAVDEATGEVWRHDGGSWQGAHDGLGGARVERLTVSAGQAVASVDGRPYRWRADDERWEVIQAPHHWISVATDGETSLVNLHDGVLRTEDGRRWNEVVGLEAWAYRDLFIREDRGLAVGWRGHLYRSFDAGKTWSPLPGPNAEVAWLRPRQGALFAGTRGEGVFRSRSGEVTWTPIHEQSAHALWGHTVLALESGEGVQLSTDQGDTWSRPIALFDHTAVRLDAGGESLWMTTAQGDAFQWVDTEGWQTEGVPDRPALAAATKTTDGIYALLGLELEGASPPSHPYSIGRAPTPAGRWAVGFSADGDTFSRLYGEVIVAVDGPSSMAVFDGEVFVASHRSPRGEGGGVWRIDGDGQHAVWGGLSPNDPHEPRQIPGIRELHVFDEDLGEAVLFAVVEGRGAMVLRGERWMPTVGGPTAIDALVTAAGQLCALREHERWCWASHEQRWRKAKSSGIPVGARVVATEVACGVLYAAIEGTDDEEAVYHSLDGGAHWQGLGLSGRPSAIVRYGDSLVVGLVGAGLRVGVLPRPLRCR
ncbi:MAG: hypothetical protein AAGA56_01315 [Myxococcota bacterium]